MLFNETIFWFIFSIIAIAIIIIDLYLTDHSRSKSGIKKSLIWGSIWIATALLFCLFIYFYFENGHIKAVEFLTGYLIEYSLSVDNLFVFLMIFTVMRVPNTFQPHILKWGILSAIVFRIIFILLGIGLINLFHPIIYFFGALLIYAAYKMIRNKEDKVDYENNWIIKFMRGHFNIHTQFDRQKFFIKKDGKIFVTSLFLTLLLIESSDIIFAVDSIPAIISVTKDPFIIITSNIFAILGLRSLYFALSGLVDLFHYLKYGVGLILFFVGIKMLLSEVFVIHTSVSLGVIIFLLAFSIIMSLIFKKEKASD
ncbi:MAG: tellurium resistance protein TerC [Ignavibacteriales bacterium CG_4_9_14_3_um_filter_30_11]|nr:MAG: tellurium resistance protein TerC [Ignavibacteriales bacterium CG_4_9_14_3_um_filter_30_11]